MKTYTADEAILAWNPNSDQVKVGPLLNSGSNDWTEPYLMTSLGTYIDIREMSFKERQRLVLALYEYLVEYQNVNPKALHKEMCKLEEYLSRLKFNQ